MNLRMATLSWKLNFFLNLAYDTMDIFVEPPTAQTRGSLWLIDIPEKREAFDFFPGQIKRKLVEIFFDNRTKIE